MMNLMEYHSPIGKLLLAERNHALVGLWMEGQKYFPDLTKEKVVKNPDSLILNQAKEWLDRYFNGERPSVKELILAPEGSGFRRAVWEMLCDIPYGKVTTYGELAKRIAAEKGFSSMAAQAVGGAVGRNPISIIIPCHRVVGADKRLTGYAGGLDKKQRLLALEGVNLPNCVWRNL